MERTMPRACHQPLRELWHALMSSQECCTNNPETQNHRRDERALFTASVHFSQGRVKARDQHDGDDSKPRDGYCSTTMMNTTHTTTLALVGGVRWARCF